MTLAHIKNALAGTGIDDVLIAGFVDGNEQPLQFYPFYDAVFFECGAVLMRFGVVGDSGRMRVARVDIVTRDGLDDEGMLPASTSVGLTILDDSTGSNRLETLHLWGVETTPDGVECAAAQLDLANGQVIFLDPTYHFGIRLGDARQYSIWLENLPGDEPKCIDLDLS